MSDVISLEQERSLRRPMESRREFWTRAVAAHELMHESIPLKTRVTRWFLRQEPLGIDFEDRLDELVNQRMNTGDQDAKIIVLNEREE